MDEADTRVAVVEADIEAVIKASLMGIKVAEATKGETVMTEVTEAEAALEAAAAEAGAEEAVDEAAMKKVSEVETELVRGLLSRSFTVWLIGSTVNTCSTCFACMVT